MLCLKHVWKKKANRTVTKLSHFHAFFIAKLLLKFESKQNALNIRHQISLLGDTESELSLLLKIINAGLVEHQLS